MNKQWINYHHLFYFRAIAQEGTIAKAAKRLRLGQPTLSTQLKHFEAALGHQLFTRQGKRLRLTDAGLAALDYANEIFRLGDEMVEVLGDRLPAEVVSLAIGAMDTVPKHLTLKLIEAAQARQKCVVRVIEGRSDELLRELRAHRIDLLLSNDAPPLVDGQNLYGKLIAKMPVVVCGGPMHAGLRRGFPASLEGQPFIMATRDSRLRLDLEHYFKLQGIRVEVKVEAQDTSLQKLLTAHGMGVTAMPAPAAQELINDGQLMLLGELTDVREALWLIASERRIQNPVAAQLMKTFVVD